MRLHAPFALDKEICWMLQYHYYLPDIKKKGEKEK